ncbi:LLM class F420-dependent oxidoreductase [Streptomyces avermitilis]
MTAGRLGVVAPFWLDRPDGEAVDIAVEARRHGYERMWIGEMATFDAFALATAIGIRAPGMRLTVGPLAVGVRGPVGLALGVASVAALTGAEVGLALGASSPDIVTGWHDRPYAKAVPRMRETVDVLRGLFAGEPADFDGEHIRTHGFRLRTPPPHTAISVAAFGPGMTRVAADHADEVVLNLVSPDQVAETRAVVDARARQLGRKPPALAVWVSVALDPGPATIRQLSSQIAVYLKPPGYGEMFSGLGFAELVERARSGEPRSAIAAAIPLELLRSVGAIGTRAQVEAAVESYLAAGADHVGIVPATADDPAGARVLAALSTPTKEHLA